MERIKTRVLVGAGTWAPVTHATDILEELAHFFNEPRILDTTGASTDDDWDDKPDSEDSETSGTIMGKMMGAGLHYMNRWNGRKK